MRRTSLQANDARGVPSHAGADSILDRLCINTIRTLAMDAVQKANSGHPGTPMALAPAAYTLWQRVLRFDCDDPHWPNRDRFVLSNGHASMLLYALLHLAGVADVTDGRARPAVTLDDIKRGSSAAAVRVIRNFIARPGSRPRPARWGKVAATASGWRSEDAGSRVSSTGPTSRSSITTSTPSAATAI